jgi:glycosyltransferase involved in cell wall biosynthesis
MPNLGSLGSHIKTAPVVRLGRSEHGHVGVDGQMAIWYARLQESWFLSLGSAAPGESGPSRVVMSTLALTYGPGKRSMEADKIEAEVPRRSQPALPVLAIVAPCYNEAPVIRATASSLISILNDLVTRAKISPKSYVYFVNDGSTDNTWELIEELHRSKDCIKGLKLSRNFGHQNALLAGLMNIKEHCDCAISIDADLQDDVAAIEEFIDRFRQGYELVYGVRRQREKDTLFKKYTALIFYRIMKVLGVQVIYNHADFRLASRRVLAALSSFKEYNLFLRGLFPLIGFRATAVYYDRRERFAGESKYPFKKMLSFALDGITSFSIIPLRLVTVSGFFVFLLSFLMSVYILFETVIRKNTVPGWASTVLPIYFIGGIQLLSIGLLGEYIGKIYKEVKSRPRYITETEIF